jgi:hypothetical protein
LSEKTEMRERERGRGRSKKDSRLNMHVFQESKHEDGCYSGNVVERAKISENWKAFGSQQSFKIRFSMILME